MAAGRSATYNLAQVIMTVNGIPIEGFGEGDAAVYDPNDDVWVETIGADGEVTRSATNDRSGTITFTLMSTSLSNSLFSAFLLAAQTVGVGDKFPVYIKDLNSVDELIAAQCWIKTPAGMSFGKQVSEREWVVFAAKVTAIHGGALV